MHQGLMNKKLRGGAAERKITESSMMRLMLLLLMLLMMMMTIMKKKNWDLFSCRLGLGLSEKKSDSSQQHQQPEWRGINFQLIFGDNWDWNWVWLMRRLRGNLMRNQKLTFVVYKPACCCWEEILGGWGLKRGVGTMLAGLSLDVSATVKGPDK